MPLKRSTLRALDFQKHVAERRRTCAAYDAGYKAFEQGKPMESPQQAGWYRSLWYEGYVDAKYPEDKYEFPGE